MNSLTFRLGTRGSALAIAQSTLVARALEAAHPLLHVELVPIRTTGDRVTDRPLAELGGKGLFTKELEQALLAGTVDLTVHSYKDVPVTMPLVDEAGRLTIAAVPERADPRDAVIVRDPSRLAAPFAGGAGGAGDASVVVGTSSLRRQCQVREMAPNATLRDVRGNVDGRLRKLGAGEYDVLVLAMAGLLRAGLFDPTCMAAMDVATCLPAPGQGALAVQCRTEDARARGLLVTLNDPTSATCVTAERELVRLLGADCSSPVAAMATIADGQMSLRAAVGGRGGRLPLLRADAVGDASRPLQVVEKAMTTLTGLGALSHLHDVR